MCTESTEQGLLLRVLLFVALFVLVIATWRAGGHEFRFQKVVDLPNPLTNSEYPPVWEIRGPFGNVDIGDDSITLKRRTDGRCVVAFPVNIAGFASATVLRLRADMDIEGESDVNRRTRFMNFYALFYRNGISVGSATLRKGLPEHRHKPVLGILRIPANADGMSLVFRCGEAQDHYRLANFSLETVEYTWVYKLAMAALLALWGLVVLGSIWWMIRRVSWKVYLPLALGVGALGAGIGASKHYFVPLLEPLHTLIITLVPALQAPSLNEWFKIGHVVFFFSIAAVLFFNHRRLRTSLVWLFLSLLMLALATEAWQMHLFGRTSQFSDVLIDLLGVIPALGLALLWDRVRQIRAPFTQRSSRR